jgi:hypothetical protein
MFLALYWLLGFIFVAALTKPANEPYSLALSRAVVYAGTWPFFLLFGIYITVEKAYMELRFKRGFRKSQKDSDAPAATQNQ